MFEVDLDFTPDEVERKVATFQVGPFIIITLYKVSRVFLQRQI